MEPLRDDARYTNDHHPDHNDFVRMNTGEMDSQEEEDLFRHLAGCPSCKLAFDAWVQNGMPTDMNNDT